MEVVNAGTALRALDDASHCGDLCAYWRRGGTVTLCIVDGLGHGKGAEEAAKAAAGYVAEHLDEPILDIFDGCNRSIASSRGVAMGLVTADMETGQLTYAGIGNTRGVLCGKKTFTMNSYYGIVGGGFRNLVPETLQACPGDLVVLWTDGIPEALDLSQYSAEARRNPQTLADSIIRDYSLGTDDAGVLVFVP